MNQFLETVFTAFLIGTYMKEIVLKKDDQFVCKQNFMYWHMRGRCIFYVLDMTRVGVRLGS